MKFTILSILSFLISHSHAQPRCSTEPNLCPDGSFVYRDINNNCEFPACSVSFKPWPIPIPPMVPPSPIPPLKPIISIRGCCDPSTRPDGTNANPMCFEGSACCPDGTWSCSIGDGTTFPCGAELINRVTNPQLFGTICPSITHCLHGQCLDPFGTCSGSVACFADPCQVNACPAAATCESNYCGGCHPVFKDTNGRVIDPVNCDPVGCGINHCTSYNDGCNVCSCTTNGVPLCTMRACNILQQTKPVCTGCEPGYMLINGRCILSCKPGYRWNPTTGSCDGCMCPMVYDPVCCSDGKTYGNSCEAACQHATGCNRGSCVTMNALKAIPPCICTMQYDPVCCSDGKTYGNQCSANCKGQSVCNKGQCQAPVSVATSVIIEPSPCGGFENCLNYNDGCNDCFCGNGIAGCTMKMCANIARGTPRCTRCKTGYSVKGNVCDHWM